MHAYTVTAGATKFCMAYLLRSKMKIVEVFFQNSKPRGGGAMSKWDPKHYFLIIELSIQETVKVIGLVE